MAPAPEEQRLSERPDYVKVGNGSLSDSARRLQAILDDDSGYGGSIIDGEGAASTFRPSDAGDQYTPVAPTADGEMESESDRRIVASHVHQMFYNRSKTALGRAITKTADVLSRLQDLNRQWPAHYPSVQRQEDELPAASVPPTARPGLHHTQSTPQVNVDQQPSRPAGLKRVGTTIPSNGMSAESSSSASRRPVQEPRLVTPQLAQDFSILKLDLKMGSASQTEIVHSLEKKSIAALLDGQIVKTIRHLHALRERIEDTSSKVLVTGDLNAGKSTFCNALLRRKVLPEDQQPCTSIFCEVLDCRNNANIEEVHAVPLGEKYDRHNESTYHAFALSELEQIVMSNDKYSQCKVYVQDIRTIDESLLNNGVVDIALIDAPGLNADSLKTTAVFARQEEIDVVVFVVSAANHFTQSAREFVFNAATEKDYIFMVVNGFDNISDKQRCKDQILKQVKQLSPASFKESSELVHFVSSNVVPTSSGNNIAAGKGGNGTPGNPKHPLPDDDDDGSDEPNGDGGSGKPHSDDDKGKGKGKEREMRQDFDKLEASLRRFVLEKRARTKLAPAKTYLLNVVGDLHSLATINLEIATAEVDRMTSELNEIIPDLNRSKQTMARVGEEANCIVEDTATETYNDTRASLTESIDSVAIRDFGVEYPGILSAYEFASDLKAAMLEEITHTVHSCEERARQRTIVGINAIKSLGLLHLGSAFAEFTFRPDIMFKRRRDMLLRQVDFDVDVFDFFDISSLWERQEKLVGTSMAVTVAGMVGGRFLGSAGWIDSALAVGKVVGVQNMRRLVIPGLVAAVLFGVSCALATVPQSLPRRLSAKLTAELERLDYTHTNAARISSEVRRALRYPAGEIHGGFERSLGKLQSRREETDRLRAESEIARKNFTHVLSDSEEVRSLVERVDLEGPAPGVAAGYDF